MRGVWRSPEERQRLVAAYRSSGVSVQAFAAREGINLGTFYGWLQRTVPVQSTSPRLARVIVPSARAAPSVTAKRPSPPVVIEIAGARVMVEAGFDKGVLASVVSVLEGRR